MYTVPVYIFIFRTLAADDSYKAPQWKPEAGAIFVIDQLVIEGILMRLANFAIHLIELERTYSAIGLDLAPSTSNEWQKSC